MKSTTTLVSGSRRRTGRPTRAQTELLNQHLLDVAERHFLAHGFEGASMDQIALDARASKQTIYHRYSGKQTLFEAVIERALLRLLDHPTKIVQGVDLEGRLAWVALDLIDRVLRPDILALLRVVIAESHRFQDLSEALQHRGWKRLTGALADALAIEVASGALRLTQPVGLAAEQFLALTLTALTMKALIGGNLAAVQAERANLVRHAIPLFLRGCAGQATSAKPEDTERPARKRPAAGRGKTVS